MGGRRRHHVRRNRSGPEHRAPKARIWKTSRSSGPMQRPSALLRRRLMSVAGAPPSAPPCVRCSLGPAGFLFARGRQLVLRRRTFLSGLKSPPAQRLVGKAKAVSVRLASQLHRALPDPSVGLRAATTGRRAHFDACSGNFPCLSLAALRLALIRADRGRHGLCRREGDARLASQASKGTQHEQSWSPCGEAEEPDPPTPDIAHLGDEPSAQVSAHVDEADRVDVTPRDRRRRLKQVGIVASGHMGSMAKIGISSKEDP